MSTQPYGHIIVHKHDIDGDCYVRIVKTQKTQDYFKELSVVYGMDVSLVYDNNIHVIYNCGDLYERLLTDIKFKKFKHVDLVYTSCDDNSLALVKGSSEITDWFNEVYLPWIETRIQLYISDMDDDSYLPIRSANRGDIDWNSVANSLYVCDSVLHGRDVYELKNYEIAKNGKIVLSREHVLSMFMIYASGKTIHEYAKETYKDTKPSSDIKIEHLPTQRGVYIDRTVLSFEDIIQCLTNENVMGMNETLYEEMCTSSLKTAMHNKTNNNNDDLTSLPYSEVDVFVNWYAFLEPYPASRVNNLLENVFDLHQCSPLYKQQLDSSLADTKNEQVCTKMLYKNVINNNMFVFDNDITYLKEFSKISKYSYTTTATANLLKFLDKSCIQNEFIEEMIKFIAIFTSNESNVPCDPSTRQATLTEKYVQRYKNDAVSTMANVVIDNVYKYLLKEIKDEHLVNKNQIGQDLVDLGVKKVRKAKGYMYGIEDTSSTISPNSFHAFVADRTKAPHDLHDCVSEWRR